MEILEPKHLKLSTEKVYMYANVNWKQARQPIDFQKLAN